MASLQVYGGWRPVAAALAQQPELLALSWQGLEALLQEPAQRQAWRAVQGMAAAAAAQQAEGSAGPAQA